MIIPTIIIDTLEQWRTAETILVIHWGKYGGKGLETYGRVSC